MHRSEVIIFVPPLFLWKKPTKAEIGLKKVKCLLNLDGVA